MNRYQPSTPRTAAAAAAAAFTALTLGLAVVLPASLGSGNEAGRPQAAVGAAAPALAAASTEVSIIPARIHVQGVREPDLAAAPAAGSDSRRARQG
jgi:hypothetical protein